MKVLWISVDRCVKTEMGSRAIWRGNQNFLIKRIQFRGFARSKTETGQSMI